jgi:uncharacterized protein (TIGR02266 family)
MIGLERHEQIKGFGAVPEKEPGGRGSKSSLLAESIAPRTEEQPRAPRVPIVAQVKLRYDSILDFHASQALNISRTGMFVASDKPGPVGSIVEFEFALADGLSLLKGKGEVVRVASSPVPGMGVRFRDVDENSRKCLEHIVATNELEGRIPDMPIDFTNEASILDTLGSTPLPPGIRSANPLQGATRVQPGLSVNGRNLEIRLTPLTVGYFSNNPLINIRLGGFVIPIDENVSLGGGFDVTITDMDGVSLFHGKGKVVAKHEHRIGIRLADGHKGVLARLQAEVGKLSLGTLDVKGLAAEAQATSQQQ